MDPTGVRIRRLTDADTDFLRAMFVHTVCWRDDVPPVALEKLLAVPELARYIAAWGRAGDDGVVAVASSGKRLGAAWYRLFDETDHGYGFVSASVPEIAIAVLPEHRARGLGGRLLSALVELASESGHPGLSLSVEDDNLRALRLYKAMGFQHMGHVQTASTMLLEFEPASARGRANGRSG